jgi:hypothetical protein
MTNREERIKLQTTVTAVIHQEGPWWVGRTEEIPRVVSRWRTSAGCLHYLKKAIRGESASTLDSWSPQPQTLEQVDEGLRTAFRESLKEWDLTKDGSPPSVPNVSYPIEQNSDAMTQHNSIEVPDELVHSWWPSEGYYERDGDLNILADKAAQWGADQELAACCEWLRLQEDPQFSSDDGWVGKDQELREARRPNVPTLNEIALQFMGTIEKDGRYLPEITSTIVRALVEGGKALKELNG